MGQHYCLLYCKKQGHLRIDSNLLKRKQKWKQADGEANKASNSDDRVILIITCMVSTSVDTWCWTSTLHFIYIYIYIPKSILFSTYKRLIAMMSNLIMIMLVKF